MNTEQKGIVRSTIAQFRRCRGKCTIPYLKDCAKAANVYIPQNCDSKDEIVRRMNRALTGKY